MRLCLAAGRLKRIHVNQHIIKANTKYGRTDPCFTIKHRGKTIRAFSVELASGAILAYHREPLSCGAHVWIESDGPVFCEVPDGS